MPRPNKNGVEKWRPKKRAKGTRFDEGYAVRVGNRVHLRHGDQSVSTKLVWSEHNKPAALKMLDEWLGRKLLGEKTDEEKRLEAEQAALTDRTVYDLHEEYVEVLGARKRSIHVIDNHKLARNLFFPVDCPLDAETLYQRIKATNADHLEISTRIKRYTYLQAFFDWVVEADLLARNPVRRLGIPEDDRVIENATFTPEELATIIAYCRERARTAGPRYGPPNLDYAVAFELDALTGMRIGELIQMHRDHVAADGFTIKGEKGGGDRIFPLWKVKPADRSAKGAWQRRIQELLAEAVERSATRGGRLFPWSDTETIWGKMKKVAEATGIDLAGRSPKTLRATAINMWADTLSIPRDVRVLLSGHTEKVEQSNYRKRKFTAEELRAKLK
jgi:integrase